MKKVKMWLLVCFVLILIILAAWSVFMLKATERRNNVIGLVLENKSLVTPAGFEYRAKISVFDRLGKEQWIWVAIPERDAKVLPLGSWLIVDLDSPGYRIITEK